MPVTTVHVAYQPSSSAKSALDVHWRSIATYLTESPKYLNAGAFHSLIFNNALFQAAVLFPKKTPEEVAALTQPWLNGLQALNITPSISETVQHPTVLGALTAIADSFGGEILVGLSLAGARILPKRLWEVEESLAQLFSTLRGIADDGATIANAGFNPTMEVSGNPDNAVLPAFRTMHSICFIAWYDFLSLGLKWCLPIHQF